MKIALASVIVNNSVDAFKFYTEVLGFTEKLFIPDAQIAVVVSPEQPEGAALLLEPNDNPIAKTFHEAVYKSGLPLIVFGTHDIYRDYERFKKSGVVFRKEPTKTEWGTVTIFEDTCGILIQLHQV